MNETRILIVHPDSSARTLMTSMLQTLGVRLEEADSDRAAVRRLERGDINLLIAGVDPDDPDALELLHYVKRKFPGLPVILLFSVADAERTREARQRGAEVVVRFPLPATQLRAAVAQLLGQAEPAPRSSALGNGPTAAIGHGGPLGPTDGESAMNSASPATVEADAGHGWTVLSSTTAPPATASWTGAERTEAVLVGEDESLRQAIELAETIAATRAPVLIHGEPGTGKSLVARTLHHQSPRGRGPFIELRCLGDPSEEIERALFGERPAVGPATAGELARARGGTLYIDDVATLGPELQGRLLRLLRDGEYEPLGSSRVERSDVRLVLGTREDLVEQVERGRFRQDLYYRISVVTLKLPPLRHRGSDIERLAEHFRARAAKRFDRPIIGFAPQALVMLRRYHWPGNVQELEAAIERAVLLCRGRYIEPGDLGVVVSANPMSGGLRTPGGRVGTGQIRPLKEALEEPEKRIILEALEALGWNRQETARVLDINRTTLYKKMKKYGLLCDEVVWAN
ncbi:sigma-54-dependent transcriptional regulator [Tautonia sociabilis]|uniref:Sigma-54-dependent Fis family transcriptional regulator n=1 Tax=Tautonia sociabilis TaxID=2080755 RepID=A0A432MP48_9BACT|nr:sigma-54 dependent transcriptional regulator [Tautonia sociabilis]RUL88848.1 sigma-54-dependent Fis family transcriptional regulator [Tautonia sociabilis]